MKTLIKSIKKSRLSHLQLFIYELFETALEATVEYKSSTMGYEYREFKNNGNKIVNIYEHGGVIVDYTNVHKRYYAVKPKNLTVDISDINDEIKKHIAQYINIKVTEINHVYKIR